MKYIISKLNLSIYLAFFFPLCLWANSEKIVAPTTQVEVTFSEHTQTSASKALKMWGKGVIKSTIDWIKWRSAVEASLDNIINSQKSGEKKVSDFLQTFFTQGASLTASGIFTVGQKAISLVGTLGMPSLTSPSHVLTALGDINNDGKNDFGIGDHFKGYYAIIYGHDQANPIALDHLAPPQGIILQGPYQKTAAHCHSFENIGDFNGDGIDDVAIGISGAWDKERGQVYIVYGPFDESLHYADLNALSNTQKTLIVGEERCHLGADLHGIDWNHDGISDIVIGADEYSQPLSAGDGTKTPWTGTAYIIYGKKGGYENPIHASFLSAEEGIQIRTPHQAYQLFGWNVHSVGDVNNDGLEDLAIGGFGDLDVLPENGGIVYIIYGQKNPTSIDFKDFSHHDGFVIYGQPYDHIGMEIVRASDINGDGIDDLILPAPFAATPSIYVIFGNAERTELRVDCQDLLTRKEGFLIAHLDREAPFAGSVTTGDWDQDGYSDILIAESTFPNGPLGYIMRDTWRQKHIYVLSGKSLSEHPLDESKVVYPKNSCVIPVTAENSIQIKNIGDFNGDGTEDLAIHKSLDMRSLWQSTPYWEKEKDHAESSISIHSGQDILKKLSSCF